jgi:hypothetical protein
MRQLAFVNAGNAEHKTEQGSISVESARGNSTDVVDNMQE